MFQIKLGMQLVGNSLIPLSFQLSKEVHGLIVGESGSGKSYLVKYMFSSLLKYQDQIEIFCMDFKNSGDYEFMDSDHLSVGKDCIEMLDRFYRRYMEIKEKNLSEKIICVFDEYAAFITWLANYDKKIAKQAMDQVSEILMMGRRIGDNGGAYMWTVLQRPDASYFGTARENYFIKIVMGNVSRSIRTMLEIDEDDIPKSHVAKTGHGIAIIGDEIHSFIVPRFDEKRMNAMLKAKRKRSLKA